MSGLREKLGRLRGPSAAQIAPPSLPMADGEWAQLGAHVETSLAGSFVMRRRVYGADSVHGKYRLRELAGVAQQLSCFHDRDAVVRLEELLFFDTETTGLGVGAGNVPFMVGIGFYTGELFTVEQLLIRNPAEEHAMLVYLQELLDRFTHIISYNGRTFDWPILKNRYVLNRLQLDDAKLLQIDLLYPSRSLWRNTLPSCRLSKVEESRLGFERVDDVPGSMAPALYFQYLAEKNPSVLEGVFVHNEHDIVTLAALAIHFGKLVSGESELDPELELEEMFRTGLWLDKMGRSAIAENYFDILYARLLNDLESSNPADQESAILLLAAFYKKNGEYLRAVELWKRWIVIKNASIALHLEPYLELAMYYEHREKNFSQAIFYAEEAWAKLWRRRSLHRGDKRQNEVEEALEKRIRRLKGKLRKAESHPVEITSLAVKGKNTSKAKTKTRKIKPIYVSEGLI
ncbi:ribonuclease H-like domain-containing protein [Paenibacillus alginolyticus]|uniref:Ribonuclease H-like domain-containing protein n=1 Tax=Paenibacillus alginolyticus TaxID=59839 RepID=A0ABT4GPP4_9BACL|nr:ribonuclease H-like domain-containing protein [Paenibacillus alginolyticus]MCY9697974.1 ribonuclease H-like domain-containing protein [Paenibacillus alginolyticus]MEC0145483.1 ribonuclease H-like domain-containing protein [Paenibacillus alginolyticus]